MKMKKASNKFQIESKEAFMAKKDHLRETLKEHGIFFDRLYFNFGPRAKRIKIFDIDPSHINKVRRLIKKIFHVEPDFMESHPGWKLRERYSLIVYAELKDRGDIQSAIRSVDSQIKSDKWYRKPATWDILQGWDGDYDLKKGKIRDLDRLPKVQMKDLFGDTDYVPIPFDFFSQKPADMFILSTPSGEEWLIDSQGSNYCRYAIRLVD
jgi:hypothetical protein